ncbi:MAG: ATP-binding protein [Thermogladius sp.]|nr:ATP-binding protein [Thermogladius sp.]
MVRLRDIKALLARVSQAGEVRVEPPDLFYINRGKVTGIRYLIGEEMDLDVRSLSPVKLYDNVERLASVIDKLPHGSEVKIIKFKLDLTSFLRKLENEMANIKASMELASEPFLKTRLEARLSNLSELYKMIVEGKPLLRLSFIVKIRVEANTTEEAKQILSYHSSIISNVFRSTLGLKIREAGRELGRILAYELGLSNDLDVKSFIGPVNAVAPVLPAPAVKKPRADYEDAILLGVEAEDGTPVVVPVDMLLKHMIVIGPTGRGKTTLLARLLEGFFSVGAGLFLAVDFKGDLAAYMEKGIARIIEPREYPLSVRGLFDSSIEAKGLLADLLSSSLQVPREILMESVEYVYSTITAGDVISHVRADILPILEFLGRDSRHKDLAELIMSDNVLANLGNYGYAYQTAYGLILLYLARKTFFQRGTSDIRLIVVDEAWRISRSRLVAELFKEGRSRRVGMVLSTQNPSDLPREVVENAHLVIIFGSPNEKYARDAAGMLGLEAEDLAGKLSRLGVGEAFFLNALDPHPVVFKVRSPIHADSDERRAS